MVMEKQACGKKRVRDPTAIDHHAKAKMWWREKLNHRFFSLYSLVPSASKRDDAAAVLTDAVSYINELQTKIEELESQLLKDPKKLDSDEEVTSKEKRRVKEVEGEVEVQMMSSDQAVVRVQTKNMKYAEVRLMEAIRDLELKVRYATISNLNDLTLQDLVVGVPPQLQTTEEAIRVSLLKILLDHA